MKLSKPTYNENVVDVDSLEKLRIQQEAETDRKVATEQELTKREAVKQKEDTKRGDGYSNRRIGFTIGASIVLVVAAIDVQRLRVESQAPKCPPPPKCPELTCQPVPVK
jgi:hypothetical protein